MARRAPKDEKPYNPIETALIQRVISRPHKDQLAEGAAAASAAALELPPASTLADELPSLVEVSKRSGREKRVILSWEDELAIEELLSQLSQELRTPVKLSNALRSCVVLLRHAQDTLRRQARNTGALSRPSNNDQAAIAQFEVRLAGIIQAAIKETEPL
jgi:hypothetical protein